MASQRKDLYVGTDKHAWWKEAVVYQVSFRKHTQSYINSSN